MVRKAYKGWEMSQLLAFLFFYHPDLRGETFEPDDHRSEQCSVVLIWPVKHFFVQFRDTLLKCK